MGRWGLRKPWIGAPVSTPRPPQKVGPIGSIGYRMFLLVQFESSLKARPQSPLARASVSLVGTVGRSRSVRSPLVRTVAPRARSPGPFAA